MVVFIPHVESYRANVKMAEYFMADAYVMVAMLMASAGTCYKHNLHVMF